MNNALSSQGASLEDIHDKRLRTKSYGVLIKDVSH